MSEPLTAHPIEEKVPSVSLTGMNTTLEQRFVQVGQLAIKAANELSVTDGESYATAAKYTQGYAARKKEIEDYWREPKQAANRMHKDLVAREKTMLQPIEQANTIVQNKMKAYITEQERIRRQAEEEARRLREEEAKRLLEEAVKAEAEGDAESAAMNMAMAETVSEMDVAPSVAHLEPLKVEGVSSRKTWKARVTNETLVPAYYNNMELRTINSSMLNTIARTTKGTAKIPGVEFYEDISLTRR